MIMIQPNNPYASLIERAINLQNQTGVPHYVIGRACLGEVTYHIEQSKPQVVSHFHWVIY